MMPVMPSTPSRQSQTAKRPGRWDLDFPDTFLPGVSRAADRALDEVLAEDFALHAYGIEPAHGRSR